MTEQLQYADYAEMLAIVQTASVRALFQDSSLQSAFEKHSAPDVQNALRTSDAARSLLCDAELIKRIAAMQLKIESCKTT